MDAKPNGEPPEQPNRQLLLRYAGIGFELAASIAGLTLLGLWVDYRFHIRPAGVLIGAGLGVIGGLYNFIRAALKLSARTSGTQRREHPSEPEQRSGGPQ